MSLAQNGYTAYGILRYYYGNNIEIVENAPVGELRMAEPPMPLRVGVADDSVRFVSLRLNRIGRNYPAIPKISNVSYIFTQETEAAVREFQRIFGLTQNGTVDQSTWYRIQFIYNGIKRLNEVESEGLTLDEVSLQLPSVLYPGESGIMVSVLQYYLNTISLYYAEVPEVFPDGIYGPQTEEAVRGVQGLFALEQTGILDRQTLFAIYDIYLGLTESIEEADVTVAAPNGGQLLTVGSSGDDVRRLQFYLGVVASVYTDITAPEITGDYDKATEDAVSQFQNVFGITVTGITGPITWDAITSEYELISDGERYNSGQYGGDIYETEGRS